jgi:adenine-specific DNA-methyltransferase
MPEKLKMHTPDLTAQNIQKLAELFPGCVTEIRDAVGKVTQGIDFDQLRQELSGSIVEGPRERYHLDWPGKREAILAANAPIAKTLRPSRNESVNFDTTKNLFIEGDNLDALKLLQETYLGKVKLIYIDPPYNRKNDLVYKDDFSESSEAYFLKSNQIDEDGGQLFANTEANGRFHSDWLTMIYSRLRLARSLMSDDGVICISIDDSESDNLRKLSDEVFGASQFIAQIVVQSNKRGQTFKEIAKTHEYIFIYSRAEDIELNEVEKADDALPYTDSQGSFDLWELRNRNPKFGRFNRPNLFFPFFIAPESRDECGYARVSLTETAEFHVRALPLNSRGDEGCWRWGTDKIKTYDLSTASPVLIARQRRDGEWNVYEKSRKSTTKVKSIWNDTAVISEQGTIELGALGLADTFDHPKPLELVKRCISLATSDGDIVMDFFAGSGTTAHALMDLNALEGAERRFILVQLDYPIEAGSSQGKQSFTTIAEITKERIRRAGTKIKLANALTAPNLDVGFRVLKIDSSNMTNVYYVPDAVTQTDLLGQVDNIRPDRSPEDLLFQVLVDWGLDLALPIATEIIEGKQVFFVDQNALAACFDTGVTDAMVKAIAQRKPLRAVFRDSSYGSDSVKINVEQIFKLLSPETEVRSI